MGGVVLVEKGRKGALKGGEREKRKGEGGRRRETTKESDGRDGGIDGKEEDIDGRAEVGTVEALRVLVVGMAERESGKAHARAPECGRGMTRAWMGGRETPCLGREERMRSTTP